MRAHMDGAVMSLRVHNKSHNSVAGLSKTIMTGPI